MNVRSLTLEEMAFCVALVFGIAGWAGLVYAALTAEWLTIDSVTAPYKRPDALSLCGVLCSIIAAGCSAYYCRKNIERWTAWLFAAWCQIPFWGLVSLFRGSGIAEA